MALRNDKGFSVKLVLDAGRGVLGISTDTEDTAEDT